MPILNGLYYSLYEGGPRDEVPVILLHGAGGSSLSWPAEMRRLAGWRVIALDLPGHGRSAGVAQQTIGGYARCVQEFITEMGLSRVILVGHSMGGAIALSVALDFPQLVAALGLVSSGAYLGVPNDFLDAVSSPLTLPVAYQLLQKYAFSSRTDAQRVDECLRGLKDVRPGVLYGDWLACSSFDLRAEVEQIAVPAWVSVGMEDQMTPVSFSHFLATRLPLAQLQLVPDAGHMLIQEQPQAAAAGLSAFLREIQPGLQSLRWSRPLQQTAVQQ